MYRKFKVCRICFRNLCLDGLVPGVKKASCKDVRFRAARYLPDGRRTGIRGRQAENAGKGAEKGRARGEPAKTRNWNHEKVQRTISSFLEDT